MANVNKIVIVDEADWKAFPEGQRCRLIRNFMRDYVNAQKGDLNDLNLEILGVQLTKLRNNIARDSAELQSKESMLKQIQDKREEERVTKIEKEKESIENQKKCVNCGHVYGEDYAWMKFNKGNICKACYLSADASQIKVWNDG